MVARHEFTAIISAVTTVRQPPQTAQPQAGERDVRQRRRPDDGAQDINASLRRPAVATFSICALDAAHAGNRVQQQGPQADRKISTMAGVSPLPKNRMAIRIKRDWRHRAARSGSTVAQRVQPRISARSKAPTDNGDANGQADGRSASGSRLANVCAAIEGPIDRQIAAPTWRAQAKQPGRIEMRGDRDLPQRQYHTIGTVRLTPVL